MISKKDCVAMLLAGGQGSRLYALTNKIAKPAVIYGGKYRIIDFPLSNCVNSGIDTVGVLTQYQPLLLSDYVGNGQPWDLDRTFGGVHILPPYQGKNSSDWYKGTANAIYQNLNYLDGYNPEYVLVLSGDHIYKMDYRKMLKHHIETSADATIAVIDVPLSEASRFGIMNTDADGVIESFEEKPKNPKSTLASMGIYIFTYDKLKKYLIEDAENKKSENDFGKNIIPAMLANKEKMVAYSFSGYWKDVGTVDSYWEAHMDLLSPDNDVELFNTDWKIYTSTEARPSQYIGPEAQLENSIVTEGCIIYGQVINSIVFPGVYIGKNTRIENSIIMENAVIEDNVMVSKSIILENVKVESHNAIGNGKDIAVIDSGKVVPSQAKME